MFISVVIPSYNRADLLPRTIQSVLSQSVSSLEIVVVDDASTDNTQEILETLKSSFPVETIKVVVHEKNKGEAAARNSGIRHASGKYIAFLDSDDEWLPNKLSQQLDFIQESGADAVTCEYYLVSDSDYKHATRISHKNNTIGSRSLLTKACGYCLGSSFLLDRETVLKNGFFDETLKLYVDMDWLYRYANNFKIAILHEPLIYYHKSPMRNGDLVLDAYKQYLSKHCFELKRFTFSQKIRSFSNFNYHVALAYDHNKHYIQALKYYFISLLQRPIRHPSFYLNFSKVLFSSIFMRGRR